MATLAFFEKAHKVIQLFKAFERSFERKLDAKMMSFISILSVLGALFASEDFVVEFTLSRVTSSAEKEEISRWVLFDAFSLILTMLGWYLFRLTLYFK